VNSSSLSTKSWVVKLIDYYIFIDITVAIE